MAKGYGTLLVIFAHLGGGDLRTWIYTFHMPLFFFLSGYLFNGKSNFVDFFKKKFKSLVIPYFALGIPLVLFQMLKYMLIADFSATVYWQLVKIFLQQRRFATLWFIACLFWVNILFYLMVKILKKEWLLGIFSIILPMVGLVYYKSGGKPLFWNMDVCLMAIPFFFVGYFCKKRSVKLDKLLEKRGLAQGMFIGLALVNLLCGYLSLDESGVGLEMFDSRYGVVVFTYMSAFAGVACVIIFSKWFVITPIKYIGENSMLYYAWHQTIMMPVVAKALAVVGVDALSSSGKLCNFIYKLIWMIGIVLITTMCNWMIKKLGLKFMLGK